MKDGRWVTIAESQFDTKSRVCRPSSRSCPTQSRSGPGRISSSATTAAAGMRSTCWCWPATRST